MTTPFSAEPILEGLKPFQRATVEHVMSRFHGDEPTSRFLVADQTGLGKSVVARGVVARTIERLQHDDSVDRIDIVYICSNMEIARQNVSRLNVTNAAVLPFASRLTLLALQSTSLDSSVQSGTKPVNLVSFTPGTSFDKGNKTGQAKERAFLYLILEEHLGLRGAHARRAKTVLRVGKSYDRFNDRIERIRPKSGEASWDHDVTDVFLAQAEELGLITEFMRLMDATGRRAEVPTAEVESTKILIANLRSTLANAGVHALSPDLIILDEFQRFRELLDRDNEASELTNELFGYEGVRVLLLSATPYKPFTHANEEDDHYADFLSTAFFLCEENETVVAALQKDLAAFRAAATSGANAVQVRDRLQRSMLRFMCRTERPQDDESSLLTLVSQATASLPRDFVAYVKLRELARHVDGMFSLEYWKSAPYFANFIEGYKLGERLKELLKDAAERANLQPMLKQLQTIDRQSIEQYQTIDAGNARMKLLDADTVGSDWWKLLWIPASMPYLQPTGVFAETFTQSVTKRLVFSSWNATPSAISALLSYEAERKIAEGTTFRTNSAEARASFATRFQYKVTDTRPESMSTLQLFWPNPALAPMCDSLGFARMSGGRAITTEEAEELAAASLPSTIHDGANRSNTSDAAYWQEAFQMSGALPDYIKEQSPEALVSSMRGTHLDLSNEAIEAEDRTGLSAHVAVLLSPEEYTRRTDALPDDLRSTIGQVGMHAPANVAWRAVQRLILTNDQVSDSAHWQAAAVIADGLRTLFSRVESTLLLEKLYPTGAYWRKVLAYCAAGNLEAVLDEHLHNLRSAAPTSDLSDDQLLEIAETVRGALALRQSTNHVFDPLNPDDRIPFGNRFALRYGTTRGSEESARLPEVRRAFNSPFWPFVLATTSAGQEGIDFHWWCHAVFHWNVVSNPVDFEQREGRVDRYCGHAIRKNISATHASAARMSEEHPWDAAYRLATEHAKDPSGLRPHWTYPGSAKVERHVAPYPFSVDEQRYERLKEDLTLYRLTFGQPRQDDLLELLKKRGVTAAGQDFDDLYLDLRPPKR